MQGVEKTASPVQDTAQEDVFVVTPLEASVSDGPVPARTSGYRMRPRRV
jgi:hypothetical protein